MANKLYVIVFTAILSNAQIISQNENNRYGDDRHGVMLGPAASTAQAVAAVATPAPINAAGGLASASATTDMSSAMDATRPKETAPDGFNANDSKLHLLTESVATQSMPQLPSIIADGFMNENRTRDQGKSSRIV